MISGSNINYIKLEVTTSASASSGAGTGTVETKKSVRVTASDVSFTVLNNDQTPENIDIQVNSEEFAELLDEDFFKIKLAINNTITGGQGGWTTLEFYLVEKDDGAAILGAGQFEYLINDGASDESGARLIVNKDANGCNIKMTKSMYIQMFQQLESLINDTNFYIEISTVGNSAGSTGTGTSTGTSTVQIKKKLLAITATKTVTGQTSGESDTYDYDTTYTFYKALTQTDIDNYIAQIKESGLSVSTLQEAIEAYISNLSQQNEAVQPAAFTMVAYHINFDYAEHSYYEYNHTDESANMAEPWIVKGPLFIDSKGENGIAQMSMVQNRGAAPTVITPSGTWTYTLTDIVDSEITVPVGSGTGDGVTSVNGKLYQALFAVTAYQQDGETVVSNAQQYIIVHDDYSLKLFLYNILEWQKAMNITSSPISLDTTWNELIEFIESASNNLGSNATMLFFFFASSARHLWWRQSFNGNTTFLVQATASMTGIQNDRNRNSVITHFQYDNSGEDALTILKIENLTTETINVPLEATGGSASATVNIEEEPIQEIVIEYNNKAKVLENDSSASTYSRFKFLIYGTEKNLLSATNEVAKEMSLTESFTTVDEAFDYMLSEDGFNKTNLGFFYILTSYLTKTQVFLY